MPRTAYLLSVVLLLLSGCAEKPYFPSASEGSAQIKISNAGDTWICINNVKRPILANGASYAAVPVNQRITVGTDFFSTDGYIETRCSSRSSFIAGPDQKYYLDFEMERERCTSLVYREDPSNRVGLAFEPTLQSSTECRN